MQDADVFLSYQSVDRAFVKTLAARLRVLAESAPISVIPWYDTAIRPGESWDPVVKHRLQSADVIVAICTPQFFESEYISEFEIPVMLERRTANITNKSAAVIPVQYKRLDIDRCALRAIQFFGKEEPISALDDVAASDALDELCMAIIDAAQLQIDSRESSKALPLVQSHAEKIRGVKRSLLADPAISPEDQLKRPVADLIESMAGLIGIGRISTTTEQRGKGVRLDMAVRVDGVIVGLVELKSTAKSANPYNQHGWTPHDRSQWEHLKDQPNLLYTNGEEWSLVRRGHGDRVRQAEISAVVNGDAPTEVLAGTLLGLLSDFLRWTPIVPSSPKALASLLAPLTRLLRRDVVRDMEAGGNLTILHAQWRSSLLPDATADSFADSYAQTFTYALLLAKLEGAESPLRAELAEQALKANGQALLATVLRVLGQEGARETIDASVALLELTIDAVEPAKFNRRPNQWLYFYEHFLGQYDPASKNARGVYYTPVEVVGCQVRVSQHILRDRLATSGFADPAVTTLDPAVGTGSYPLAIIQEAMASAASPSHAATQLANNLFGFELLVGPYAVAHLRLTQALEAAGARMPEQGANIILTDTLAEPATGDGAVLELFTKALVEEQGRASAVKRADKRVTVIVGNPPYNRPSDGSAERLTGGMIRFAHSDGTPPLLDDFIGPLRELGHAGSAFNLYNDYVFFWRWAMWKIENESIDSPALISFITPSSFLKGRAFAGMRRLLRRQFDELWILDLGGEGRGGVKEENVFDILTPVSITFAIRFPADARVGDLAANPAVSHYRKVSGSRAEKYGVLNHLSVLDREEPGWVSVPGEWDSPLVGDIGGEFGSWSDLDDLFPWSSRGIQFSRTWPVSESKAILQKRWRALAASKEKATINELLRKSDDSHADATPQSFLTGEPLPSLASLDAKDDPEHYALIAFRSFDVQWCIADRRVIDRPRPALWRSRSAKQLYLTSMESTSDGPAVVVSAHVPDLNAFSSRGGEVRGLYRTGDTLEPNVADGTLDLLTSIIGSQVNEEDLLAYVVGLCGTQAYQEMFAEQLAGSRPRVPITRSKDLFKEVVALGRELVWWGTFGERFQPTNQYGGLVSTLPRGTTAELQAIPQSPSAYPSQFSYDASTQSLRVGDGVFGPVSPAQWEFAVSGNPVVSRWLGTRIARQSSGSSLDDLKPSVWDQSEALLELLAVIEGFVNREEQARELLERVVSGSVIAGEELPVPTKKERTAPTTSRKRGPRAIDAVTLGDL